MKTSIQHNSIAWLSQFGTGEIVFVPLAQSSSFTVNVDRVTHKGIGAKNLVGNYRYKSDEVTFNLNTMASNERLFGTQLSRTNFATENYVSGEITGYSLSGCQSALYDLVNNTYQQELSFYSIYDDVGDNDIIQTLSYSGFYSKFHDCLLEDLEINAVVGEMVSVDTSYSARDVSFLRTGISYISGINESYEAVRPQDVMVMIGSGTGMAANVAQFNIQSLTVNLPIQYKKVETFGNNKVADRKIVLPAIGTVRLEGFPVEFNALGDTFFNSPDTNFNMTILMRAQQLRSSNVVDYTVIKIPKLYLNSQTLDGSVGSRIAGSVEFSFFEYGSEYSSGEEGIYFLRKMPDEITYITS